MMDFQNGFREINESIIMSKKKSHLCFQVKLMFWFFPFFFFPQNVSCFTGSLLDFLKEGEGKYLKLPQLVDMAAQVPKKLYFVLGHGISDIN